MRVASLIERLIALGPVAWTPTTAAMPVRPTRPCGSRSAPRRLSATSSPLRVTRPGAGLRHRRARRRRATARGSVERILTATRRRGWRRGAARSRGSARPGMCRGPHRPPEEVRLRGRRHSQGAATPRRSRTTTTCPTGSTSWCSARRWPTPAPCYPDADADPRAGAVAKFDLVCRKLGLQPGHAAARRRLRLGRHGHARRRALRRHGARRDAVAGSRPSGPRRRSPRPGLSDRAEIRHIDYRDVPETGFDAVSSIGLTEHIGARNLPAYFRFLAGQLRPGGRLLNHCITRPTAGSGTTPAGSSTATSSPTASSRASARSSPRCRTTASRSATRRTCASTTR